MPNLHGVRGRMISDGYLESRARYLAEMHKHNGGRNIIVYYSGWLQKPELLGLAGMAAGVNDLDKNGFMSVIQGMERSKGLDLVLHTPGGDIAAAESLVQYLREMFEDENGVANIRAVVPQLALSAGTMIACATQSILMGKHSSLGPIDPQMGTGIAAHGVVEEFERAYDEIKNDGAKVAVWQPIIAKYPPTLVGECEKAIAWANEMVEEWLMSGMLADVASKEENKAKSQAKKIVEQLADHVLTKSHGRHLSAKDCRDIGLTVEMLEDKEKSKLQDAVLSVHHACMLTLMETDVFKIIENHKGVGVLQNVVMHPAPANSQRAVK